MPHSSECKHPNCSKRPSFGNKTQFWAKYCAEHKKKNMVNVRKATSQLIGTGKLAKAAACKSDEELKKYKRNRDFLKQLNAKKA